MTVSVTNAAEVMREIEQHPFVIGLGRIYRNAPLVGGIEAAYVAELFKASSKRLAHAGHARLLIDAARSLIEAYYPHTHVILLHWSKAEHRHIAEAVANNLASRPGVKQLIEDRLKSFRNDIFANARLTLGQPQLIVFEEVNETIEDDECNIERPIDTFNRALSFIQYMKKHDIYLSLFPLYQNVTSLARVSNAIDAFYCDTE